VDYLFGTIYPVKQLNENETAAGLPSVSPFSVFIYGLRLKLGLFAAAI